MLIRCMPLVAVVVVACENGRSSAPEPADTTTVATTGVEPGQLIDLGEYDMPLLVRVPDARTAQADSILVHWNEDRGWLEVGRGEHFGLRIMEQPGDLLRLKADLERDLVHRNTIVSEGPDAIIYRQEFPADASLVFLHFLAIVKVGARSFTVESAPEGRFTEADVRRMASAVTSSDPT